MHPDVKRMLLHGRAFVEGARALACLDRLQHVDRPIQARPKRRVAALLADLMTPVLKAFCTDMGFEAANLAMQCYGGHGYIRDNGVEQFVRDGRINQTYEGANGVQAMDLVGRKLGRKGGAAPMALFALLTGWLAENEKDEALAPYVKGVKRGVENLAGRHHVAGAERPQKSQRCRRGRLRLSAPDGHRDAGLDVGPHGQALRWARTTPFHKDKLMCARYWMERMVPECPMLLERIQAGSANLMDFN